MMPKWSPGQRKGENVRTKYLLAVKFSQDGISSLNNIIQEKKEKEKKYDEMDRFYHVDLPSYGSTNFSGYRFFFHLCSSGDYHMSFGGDNDYSIVYMTYPLSFGKYEIKNDTMVLTDSYNHAQLLFQLDSGLTPIKAYPFMKEMAFKDYYKVCNMRNESYGEEIVVEKKIRDFEKTQVQNTPCDEGIYKHEIFNGTRFELILKSNGKYEFNFKEEDIINFIFSTLNLYLVISGGTWERKGNILMLWDTILQHQFYGLIREDGIELLFFRWDNVVFKR
jgi:hypothetical protein